MAMKSKVALGMMPGDGRVIPGVVGGDPRVVPARDE
jgi:hypothetical protein